VERTRQDFTQRLATCRLSISQAGYNTVMEILSLGTPAVVVPFAAGSETEQSLRARLLATRGLLTVVEESGLTPKRLAEAIDAALEKQQTASPVLPNLNLDGAGQTATILQELIAKGPP
jgi:predicted glycosyltransferase